MKVLAQLSTINICTTCREGDPEKCLIREWESLSCDILSSVGPGHSLLYWSILVHNNHGISVPRNVRYPKTSTFSCTHKKSTDYIQSRYSGTQSRLIKLGSQWQNSPIKRLVLYLCSVTWVEVVCFCFVQITCCFVLHFMRHFVYAARPSALHPTGSFRDVSGTWHKRSIIEQRRHGIWLAAGNIVSTVHQHLHMDRQGRLNPFDLHNIPSCHVSSSCIDMSNQIESNNVVPFGFSCTDFYGELDPSNATNNDTSTQIKKCNQALWTANQNARVFFLHTSAPHTL